MESVICSTSEIPEHDLDAIVVIDVLRAFTVAPWVLRQGAERLVLAADDETAHRLRMHLGPDALVVQDVGAGGDLPNSPGVVSRTDLRGRTVVQRTTHGTVGAVAAIGRAPLVLCAALVTATATARLLREHGCRRVAFVVTGQDGAADEDRACADLVVATVAGRPRSVEDVVERVRGSRAAVELHRGREAGYRGVAADDVDLACEVDRFDVGLVASVRDSVVVLELRRPSVSKV